MHGLIATDLDGTLLRSDQRIGARTLAALEAASEAGIDAVAVSGRPAWSIASIVAGSPLEGVVIASNGAVIRDCCTREVLAEETLEVSAQRMLVEALVKRFPQIRVRSVRCAGDEYVIERGAPMPESGHAAWPITVRQGDLDEVLAEPSVKLVVEHPEIPAETLLHTVRTLALPCHPTLSGGAFLEVGPPGITKAVALARLCVTRGLEPAKVIAFGDNINDVEMLAWAGTGIAMGNAAPEALNAADRVTRSNDEEGIAHVLERLLRPQAR